MADYSAEGLGEAIRSLRHGKLTQEELGRRAGYQGGAGVSVSRLESGQMEPSDERFDAIARELGVTREELVSRAAANTKALRSAGGGNASLEHRIAQIERVNQTWDQLLRDLEALTIASDRAKHDFLLRFREIAERLDGAPPPDPRNVAGGNLPRGDDTSAEATLQIEFTKFGIEHALARSEGEPKLRSATNDDSAFTAFTNLVAMRTFPLGQVLPLVNAAVVLRALQKTTGMRVGLGVTALATLTGFAVSATALLRLATATQMRKLKQALAVAEAQIDEIQPGLEAMQDLVPRATKIFDYIALHASHALGRWESQVGPAPRSWSSLSKDQQKRYYDFVEIAAAQLAIATSSLDDLLTTRGDEREQVRALADEVLTQSWRVVTSSV
jgi:transcriptional regulator with XRE-family HTH domain